MNTKLQKYKVKMDRLKVDEALIIPWHEFIGGKPKERKPEKPISDGKFTWLCTQSENGMIVKRIE